MDDKGYISGELQRLAREIERAQHTADNAQVIANGAENGIGAHEQLCALRYETITTKLSSVPHIYTKLDQVMKVLYIGVGVWLAVVGLGVVVGIVYTLFHFAKGV